MWLFSALNFTNKNPESSNIPAAAADTVATAVHNQKYLGVIYGEQNEVQVFCIDPDIEEIAYRNVVEKNEAKDYLKDMLPAFHQEFKAIFVVPSNLFKPDNYSSSYEFWKDLKAMLDSFKIPNHFFIKMRWYLSSFLVDAEYSPTINDIVLFITTFDDEVNVLAYRYTEDGYLYLSTKDIDISNAVTDENIRSKVSEICEPAAIFLNSGTDYLQRLKRILHLWKLYAFVKNGNFVKPNFAVKQYKWFMNKRNTKFHVRPDVSSLILLSVKAGSTTLPYIAVPSHTPLPINKTESVRKIVRYCNVSMKNKSDESPTILETWLPEQNAHQHEISLSVNEEGFIDYQIKGTMLPHIPHFCQTLSIKMKSAVPVITFVDNLSFICVRKSDSYEFLQGWNGSLGMDLYISFEEEKPKFCQNALKAVREKPTFVVFDIFSLMYASPENTEKFKHHPFEVTKDNENPILLEFDTFDETRKLATPAFLMAMLLKQHLKAIKEEIGEKPKQVAFFTFHDLDDDEKERYQRQMTEACQMLSISCTFLSYNELYY